MTHIRHMNDAVEFSHGLDLFKLDFFFLHFLMALATFR
jgi:hypothetical protein